MSLVWPAVGEPSLPITEQLPDSTLRASVEGGYELTRPRYTRQPREWSLTWPAMIHSQYQVLVAFYSATTVGGSRFFAWTSPIDGASRAVRFAGPPEATVVAWALNQVPRYWQVRVNLREV